MIERAEQTLYVMRHAEAAPVGGAITRDADRELSHAGEEAARLMGAALAGIEPELSLILTSPLTRARNTGELVRAQLGASAVVKATEKLSPGFRPKPIIEELGSVTGPVMVIGHQPEMSGFIAYLISGSSHAAVEMSPASLACLSVSYAGSRADARLVWLLTPDAARALGRKP